MTTSYEGTEKPLVLTEAQFKQYLEDIVRRQLYCLHPEFLAMKMQNRLFYEFQAFAALVDRLCRECGEAINPLIASALGDRLDEAVMNVIELNGEEGVLRQVAPPSTTPSIVRQNADDGTPVVIICFRPD